MQKRFRTQEMAHVVSSQPQTAIRLALLANLSEKNTVLTTKTITSGTMKLRQSFVAVMPQPVFVAYCVAIMYLSLASRHDSWITVEHNSHSCCLIVQVLSTQLVT